jgi:Ribophorin I
MSSVCETQVGRLQRLPACTRLLLVVLQYEFSAEILSHTKPAKGEKKARSVLYGPFTDVAPLTLAPVEFHYVNNAPFAEARTLERTLNIVWNTIYVEERYVVVSAHGHLSNVPRK